jgi:hypothetical protein
MAALDQMSQPNPEAQQFAQQRAQLELQALQAQALVNATQAERNRAEAAQTMVETQLKPAEIQAKTLSAATQNLPDSAIDAEKEFEKRVKIAELMLKEKDIENKLEVVKLQNAVKNDEKMRDNDFLRSIIGQ